MKNVHAMCFATLLTAGLVGAANAQAPTPPAAPAAAAAQAQAPAGLAAGQKVYNAQNQEIGTIDTVIAGANGGAVVSVGQFLGLGEKKVLLPASDLRARAQGGFTTAVTADRLRQMPAHN
jgi:hypothetical protein